jgi:VanZ family protein
LSRAAGRWVAACAYAALLVWLGRQPGEDLPRSGLWDLPGADKVVHAGAYGVLGLLVAWAARCRHPLRAAGAGVLAAAMIGLLDEWGQASTVGRDSSAADLVADLIGGGLGGALAAWLGERLGRRFIPRQNG